MSPSSDGVTELLRRASDGLDPDVDRLVSGGISRGRTRRRRTRIGTTVASLAVVGVIGTLAAVVPHVDGADSARDPGIATDGTSATEAPSPTLPPASPVPFGVKAVDIPREVDRMMLDLGEVSGPLLDAPYGVLDTVDEKIVHFRIRGMLTTFTAKRTPRPDAAADSVDGTSLEGTEPATADGVTSQSVTAWRNGYAITLLSYNAAAGKDSVPLQPRPALSLEQLAHIAISLTWFGG